MPIDYRVMYENEEFNAACELEEVVWGAHPRDVVPPMMMRVAAFTGGITLGAFDEERVVGMSFATPARRGGETFLWSYVTAVHPDYRRQGIGYNLKRLQRMVALQKGYSVIRWTYDPLRLDNAHFNLWRLGGGVIADVYHVDFYGTLDDDLNRGVPSDRLEVTWDLNVQQEDDLPPPRKLIRLLEVDLDQYPVPYPYEEEWDADFVSIAIPRDLDALTREHANARMLWRLALRDAMQIAFAREYVVVDFLLNPVFGEYLLKRL
jgi:predicted GNAT superfamily acetyltransferase